MENKGNKDILDKTGEGVVNITQITNEIIKMALEEKASDIHIEPREKCLLIRFRIDGILREMLSIKKFLESNVTFRLKLEAKMRIDEHLAPQDGGITFNFDGKKIDTRVSSLPTVLGEKIVIRILTKEDQSFRLEDLGFEGRELDILNRNYKRPFGMILATGPTGSGKTTTLYSLLKLLNSPDKNITTIEDPVEFKIEGVNHIQINAKAKLTFANGLRSILRQDPNIIMVGEIRDKETAKIAINAALTGHLVLSTIHTNDAITTIPRLEDMDIDPFLIASTVSVVVGQRLARKLCKNCKKETELSQEDLNEIKLERPDVAALLNVGEKIFMPGGCSVCSNRGYRGRIGIYEVFEVNESIRKEMKRGLDPDNLLKVAREFGFVLMLEDGIKKVKGGITSIEEIMGVTVLKE